MDSVCGDKLEEGDAWVYTCLKRESYLLASFSVGKWTQETCRAMFEKLTLETKTPSLSEKLQVFSDGNDDYTVVLPEYYPVAFVDYGQLVKIKKRGKLVGKIKTVVYGSPQLEDIETTNVENHNGIFRERVGRLVRKTKCVSKKKSRLVSAVGLFQFYWNFINEFERDTSPGMMEGLADHIWSWGEFFDYHISSLN